VSAGYSGKEYSQVWLEECSGGSFEDRHEHWRAWFDNRPKDHEIRETVNQLTAVAREFHATQQLRQRIADVVVPMLQRA